MHTNMSPGCPFKVVTSSGDALVQLLHERTWDVVLSDVEEEVT